MKNENIEEFNSYIPCASQIEFEKQFQYVYTISEFKEFQQEILGKISCYFSRNYEKCDGYIKSKFG